MVPVVGLEPTRVAPTDFESVTSAIPSHRRTDSFISISNFQSFVNPEQKLSQTIQIGVAAFFRGMFHALIAPERAFAIGSGGDFSADFQRKNNAEEGSVMISGMLMRSPFVVIVSV